MRTFRQDVIELGKKSILDGFGLALAGSASVMGADRAAVCEVSWMREK